MDDNSSVLDGYRIIGDFDVPMEDITGMKVDDKPLNVDSAKKREDKGVILRVDGDEKRISSVMLGYNKRGIELHNDFFVNVDEVKEAILRAIASTGTDSVVISRKTGKSIDMSAVQEIIREAVLTAGKMDVSSGYESIKNTDSRRRTVVGANDGPKISSPVILGKKGLQLPCGEYVSAEEIAKGLREYVVATQIPQNPTGVEHKNDNDNYVVRVTHKYKSKITLIMLIISMLIALITGFRMGEKQNIYIPQNETQIEYNVQLGSNGCEFTIDGQTYSVPIDMDECLRIYNGTQVSEYGNGTGNKLVVGESRSEGDYTITGFAIELPNGTVYYNEKFDKNGPANTNLDTYKQNLNEFISEVLKKNPDLTVEDLEISIHFGSNTDRTRLGWISINDLIKSGKYNFNFNGSKANSYTGVVPNHSGNNITINTPNGQVQIPVKDANGNYFQSGTVVYGSDGQLYVLNDITVETKTVNVDSQTPQQGITWNIANCNFLAASLPMVAALAAAAKARKLNEAAKNQVQHTDFQSEQEYKAFLEEFKQTRVEYDSKSKLAQWFIQKRGYVQRLTDEQIAQIYEIIKSTYGNDVEIKIVDNKFVIKKPDGTIQKINPDIIKDINKIGEDNPYVARSK